LQFLGFELSREELDAVYLRFTAAADRKKGLNNEEIIGIVRAEIGRLAHTAAE
jgi:hypothetical protein